MKRSPAAALWLSLLPGAGHVYIGQASKGLVLIMLAAACIHLADRGPDGFQILIPFLWFFAMIDAYRGAQELNHLLETGREPKAPMSFGFSSWWGWGLIAVGVLFALENFGVSMDWIWDLWPLALIGLGIYILRKPRADEPQAAPPAPPVMDVPQPITEEPGTRHEGDTEP